MDEDPAHGVRRKKDSTLVRAAEAVRDGKASAMVSAGNTGATMAVGAAAHGPHQGRQPAGDRHADPGARRRRRPSSSTPAPTPRCQPEWLVQFAQMGSVYARHRFGIADPKVGLLSIGEEPGKGDTLRKEAYDLLAAAPGIDFVGNVEGRDIMTDDVDVVVTDGFTGNVVLKTLEGGVKVDRQARCSRRFAPIRRTQRARRRAAAGAAAALRDARPRHLRRRRAARRRRGVHHLPRLVDADGDGERHQRRPARWSSTTSSSELRAAIAPLSRRRELSTYPVRRRPGAGRDPRRTGPARTATRSSSSSATASPTSSRSSRRRSPRASRSSTTSRPTRSP